MPYDKNWVVIERVLKWKRGSVESILAGHGPMPIRDNSPPEVPPIPGGVVIDPADWAIMTPQERADYIRIVTGVRRRREQQKRGA